MFVKPARPGLIIRRPENRIPLQNEGAEVPENSYWLRRLLSGDVVKAIPGQADANKVTVLEGLSQEGK